VSSAAVAGVPAECCWLLTLLLSDSGGPAAVDIHDVPIVPADAVISDVNSFADVVGLPACCCWLHYLCKHPDFADVSSILAILYLLSFLLLIAFLLLWTVILVLSSL
jgi:hypothetical protein